MKVKVFAAMLVTALACICGCGLHREPMPELSSEYYIGADYGGCGFGSTYDCFSGEVIVCTNKDLLVYMPRGEVPNEYFKMETFHKICKELGAGVLQSAEAGKDGSDDYLDIVTQDGIHYRYFHDVIGHIKGVKNLDTGEWPYYSVE